MKQLINRYDLQCCFVVLVISIVAIYFEWFSLLENQTLSFRHILRNSLASYEKTQFPIDQIVIITIDEKFFDAYKGFPLRRTDIGKIITNLKILGAQVIGVDLLMDYTSSYGEDPVFMQALKQAGNVVMASRAVFDDNNQFQSISYPPNLFRQASKSGYVNISSSSIVTTLTRLRIYPEITNKTDGWPISVQILANYLNATPKLVDHDLIIGPLTIPLDRHYDLYIDYPSIPTGYQFIKDFVGLSALEFLDISQLDEDELFELQHWINGKIVLIGETTEVSHDWFDTPTGMVYGVEIIANTIQTMLKQGSLKPVPFLIDMIICMVFIIGIITISLIIHEPKIQSLGTGIFFIIFISVGTTLYISHGIIISMSYPILAGFSAYGIIGLHAYIQEQRQKQELKKQSEYVRNVFGRYLSDEIVQNILDTPGGLQLGGVKKRMTIMMTDLRGFTAIGERLPPEDVVSIINNYLSVMTPIIVKYQGTIDEFIGDAILVIFGAPISRKDDTIRAVACAIEMQLAMDIVNKKNREKGYPEVEQGIGLNTGEVVVGNIGSEIRSKYGVVGKNVNLTSRIESYTVGGQTYISEATMEEVKDILIVGNQMEVMPKGVKHPITIFEARGIGGDFCFKLPAAKPPILADLKAPLQLEIIKLSGKHASDDTIKGHIQRLSEKTAEIHSLITMERLDNLKLSLFNDASELITKDLYGKVTDVIQESLFWVNFTSIPPDAEKAFATAISCANTQTAFDQDTGLYSESFIHKILTCEIQESAAFNIPLSILLISIDKTCDKKQLFSIVTCIKNEITCWDSVGQYQSDRIMVIAINTSIDKAWPLGVAIRKSVENYKWQDNTKLTISCGIAEYQSNQTDFDFIQCANNYLNHAIKLGGNRVEGKGVA